MSIIFRCVKILWSYVSIYGTFNTLWTNVIPLIVLLGWDGWVISNRFLSSLDQLSVRQLHLHRVILIPVCYQTVNRARNVFDVLVVKSQPVGRLHAEKSIKTLPLNAWDQMAIRRLNKAHVNAGSLFFCLWHALNNISFFSFFFLFWFDRFLKWINTAHIQYFQIRFISSHNSLESIKKT